MNICARLQAVAVALAAAATVLCSAASAQPLGFAPAGHPSMFNDVLRDHREERAQTPVRFRRQVVHYSTKEAPGTVIIDTPNTYLYYVLGGGRAVRYGIGVGREGFTWSGVQSITKKAEWPDWTPPAEMLARQPYLPRFMAGGPGNPLGARAMYLGETIYRIHGTNQPETIGTRVSSGCIRMLNEDVIDLYQRVNLGGKVVVLPMGHYRAAAPRPATTVAGHSTLRSSGLY
jgi:lipoprotein-anchoring transpeptidase ErfK/SrfK